MGQWFSDNLGVLIAIGVVVVFMVAYLGWQLYRERRKRAAAAKAKRQAGLWPNPHAVPAESHMDIGFADANGRPVLMVTLRSDEDVQTLGKLMPLLDEGVDIAVVESDFVGAHSLRCIAPGIWAVKSEAEGDWDGLRTADVLRRLGQKVG